MRQVVKGFTLLELMVAIAVSSILMLVALGAFRSYHRMAMTLYSSYQRESSFLIDKMHSVQPYQRTTLSVGDSLRPMTIKKRPPCSERL